MSSSEPKRILVVDDEDLNLKLFSMAFTRSGNQCLQARSAAEAIQILEEEIPDIILSDYQMPGLNGFEFRKKLMEDVRWRNIPFIFLTSHTDQETMLKGLNLQVIDYLAKNTPIEILVSKVSNILHAIEEENKRSIQELRKAAEALNLRSVPEESPVIDGYKIDFWHQAYEDHPGGDFIDFIKISEDYTFIILGDIMGKRWGAWVFSFSFLSYIRSAVRLCVFENDLSVASILRKINHVVYMDQVLNDVLSSLSLLLLDHKSGKVSYSGAGDIPLIWYRASSGISTQVNSSGLLLGLFADGKYNEQVLQLDTGDKLLMLSDGMIDFRDEKGKKSDYKLFIDTINPFLGGSFSLDEIKDNIFFKEGNKKQIDDCSIIFIEKTQKP